MAITLNALVLSDTLRWVDEFQWTPIAQKADYTLTGALVLQEATKQAGRPITLGGGTDFGWMERSVITSLDALRVAGQEMTLTLHDGRSFTVVWDHSKTPLDVKPIRWPYIPAADEYVSATLRFLVVSVL